MVGWVLIKPWPRGQAFSKLRPWTPSQGLNKAKMEHPTAAAHQPEYNDDVKEKQTTPSIHSKDGSKEREAGAFNDMPAYTDVEGQEGEIHLDTAADIVTQVIDLDDDPSINPWTFRMFFLGTAAPANALNTALSPLLTSLRNGPFVLRSRSRGDLLLQAPSPLRIAQ